MTTMEKVLVVYNNKGSLECYMEPEHNFTAVQISEAVRKHLGLASHSETEAEFLRSFQLRGEELEKTQGMYLDLLLRYDVTSASWRNPPYYECPCFSFEDADRLPEVVIDLFEYNNFEIPGNGGGTIAISFIRPKYRKGVAYYNQVPFAA